MFRKYTLDNKVFTTCSYTTFDDGVFIKCGDGVFYRKEIIMNKYILYYFGLLVGLTLTAHGFFTTKAKIKINNYNNDQAIAEWIMFALVVLIIIGMMYSIYFYIEKIIEGNS